MTKTNFSNTQINSILNQSDNGAKISDICKEHGINRTLFYKWRNESRPKKPEIKSKLGELEAENILLKKIYLEERIKFEKFKESLN